MTPLLFKTFAGQASPNKGVRVKTISGLVALCKMGEQFLL
jgi:hypothetical protein